MDSSITIVTAFFDIGRGDWTAEKGHPKYLHRTTDQYLNFFENLAKLENDMIIFTSAEFKEEILAKRKNKKTTIITLDLNKKFDFWIKKISAIQKDDDFRSKVNPEQLNNPEYWSAQYVLINNLKAYFVKCAIQDVEIKTPLIAWVDFGYCRDQETLNHLTTWKYGFNAEKVHLFTIRKKFEFNLENVEYAILNNAPYIIGGAIIASKDKWLEFYQLVFQCQQELFSKNIVDDDQGVFLLACLKKPELIQLNFLGTKKWFSLFKRYSQNRHIFEQVKMWFGF